MTNFQFQNLELLATQRDVGGEVIERNGTCLVAQRECRIDRLPSRDHVAILPNFRPRQSYRQAAEFHDGFVFPGISVQDPAIETKPPPRQPQTMRVTWIHTVFIQLADQSRFQLRGDGFPCRPYCQANSRERSDNPGEPTEIFSPGCGATRRHFARVTAANLVAFAVSPGNALAEQRNALL